MNSQRGLSAPPRILARIDVRQNHAIKPIRYDGLKIVGDPNELALNYASLGCDEILFLDVVASLFRTNHLADRLRHFRNGVNIPVVAGGGVRSKADALALLRAGADKVAINTHAVQSPQLIAEIAQAIGSQSCCLLIEARPTREGHYLVTTNGATQDEAIDMIEWVKTARLRGAGEVFAINVDRDGTKRGVDLKLAKDVADAIDCPVIASGGFSASSTHHEDLARSGIAGLAIGAALHSGQVDPSDIRDSWATLSPRTI